jgi:hypothetical protein
MLQLIFTVMMLAMLPIMGMCVSLKNVTRQCGANPPGIITLYAVRAAEVTSIPDATYNTISGDLVMASGKKFAVWEFSEESGKLEEKAIGEIDGRSYDCMLDIFIPGVDATNDFMFDNALNDRFILISKDGSGNLRIHGEVGRGMRMEVCEFTTGDKPETRRGTTLQFKRNFGHKSYFYTGAIASL